MSLKIIYKTLEPLTSWQHSTNVGISRLEFICLIINIHSYFSWYFNSTIKDFTSVYYALRPSIKMIADIYTSANELLLIPYIPFKGSFVVLLQFMLYNNIWSII